LRRLASQRYNPDQTLATGWTHHDTTQIAEAIHLYGPDYGFDTTVNHFDWKTLVKNRSAYIDRIHTSYDNVL